MKPGQRKIPAIVMGIAGSLAAVWLGMAVAPGAGGGLRGMVSALTSALNDPLRFHIVPDTPRCVLVCLFIYGLAVLMFVSSGMNFRRGEEYGSAKWGSPRAIDRKYRDRRNPNANLIMTQHVAIGSSQESMYRHRRNLNTVVIGGSGSGKSTTHVLINLLQASHSYEYLSKLLGKQTIRTNTFGQSKGRSGSFSKNEQQLGRELLTPDEIRMLDNKLALLFVRGERPILDEKYDFKRHPHIKETTYGGAAPYVHNELTHIAASFAPVTDLTQEQVMAIPEARPVWFTFIDDNKPQQKGRIE